MAPLNTPLLKSEVNKIRTLIPGEYEGSVAGCPWRGTEKETIQVFENIVKNWLDEKPVTSS